MIQYYDPAGRLTVCQRPTLNPTCSYPTLHPTCSYSTLYPIRFCLGRCALASYPRPLHDDESQHLHSHRILQTISKTTACIWCVYCAHRGSLGPGAEDVEIGYRLQLRQRRQPENALRQGLERSRVGDSERGRHGGPGTRGLLESIFGFVSRYAALISNTAASRWETTRGGAGAVENRGDL